MVVAMVLSIVKRSWMSVGLMVGGGFEGGNEMCWKWGAGWKEGWDGWGIGYGGPIGLGRA